MKQFYTMDDYVGNVTGFYHPEKGLVLEQTEPELFNKILRSEEDEACNETVVYLFSGNNYQDSAGKLVEDTFKVTQESITFEELEEIESLRQRFSR